MNAATTAPAMYPNRSDVPAVRADLANVYGRGCAYQVTACRKEKDATRKAALKKSNIEKSVENYCKATAKHGRNGKSDTEIDTVQPRRDPTGSQKDKRRSSSMLGDNIDGELDEDGGSPAKVGALGHSNSLRSMLDNIKREEDDDGEMADELKRDSVDSELPSDSSPTGSRSIPPPLSMASERPSSSAGPGSSFRIERPWELRHDEIDEYEKFERLVICYQEHHRLMQLAMTPIDAFLQQHDTGISLRKMLPTDVEKLSTTELSGLLYWIEKLEPYRELHACDRTALLKRYSVRKLSLDHFYIASKWKAQVKLGNFVMLNNTFVPPGETGFEGANDDENQRAAKQEIFRPTFERIWRCVIAPFVRMRISDAEMVILHTLLLWSPLNNMHVLAETKEKMRARREWAIQRLFEHYDAIGQREPEVRFGEVCMLLSEIEVICDQHCQDFQVAKLFEFCDMSQYWYEKWCYSSVNTMQIPAQSCVTPPPRGAGPGESAAHHEGYLRYQQQKQAADVAAAAATNSAPHGTTHRRASEESVGGAGDDRYYGNGGETGMGPQHQRQNHAEPVMQQHKEHRAPDSVPMPNSAEVPLMATKDNDAAAAATLTNGRLPNGVPDPVPF